MCNQALHVQFIKIDNDRRAPEEHLYTSSMMFVLKACHVCSLFNARSAVCSIIMLIMLMESAKGLARPTCKLRVHRNLDFCRVTTSTDPLPLASRRRSLLFLPVLAIGTVCPSWAAESPQSSNTATKLTFQTLNDSSGVRVADILAGANGEITVMPTSKVNVHIKGRLLGKQGWIFEDSQGAGEDPFRLDLGNGSVIQGLEAGMQGMHIGGRRRIVIPSAVGYTSRSLEPIPRDFGNRQRLYTTVMNSVRIDRERQALGADLAGVVVLDVELLRIRN